jgi:hypothetical protein
MFTARPTSPLAWRVFAPRVMSAATLSARFSRISTHRDDAAIGASCLRRPVLSGPRQGILHVLCSRVGNKYSSSVLAGLVSEGLPEEAFTHSPAIKFRSFSHGLSSHNDADDELNTKWLLKGARWHLSLVSALSIEPACGTTPARSPLCGGQDSQPLYVCPPGPSIKQNRQSAGPRWETSIRGSPFRSEQPLPEQTASLDCPSLQ